MELLTPEFNIAFLLIPILVVGVIAFIIFKMIRNGTNNRSQPRVAAEATIVTKRTDYSSHHSSDNFHRTTSRYYVTFEFSTGDRQEFLVNPSEYGLLAEDDKGILTFQGNSYIGFQRKSVLVQ